MHGVGEREWREEYTRGEREKTSSSVKLALLAFPYSYTGRPKLIKRLLRRLAASRRLVSRCDTIESTCICSVIEIE